MTPRLRTIDRVHVFVSDRVAAEKWYARVLGLRRKEDLEFWAADGGPLTIANEEDTVHIALFERPKQSCHSVIALYVNAVELRAWQEHLTPALGKEPTIEDHDVSWSLYFQDPDGNPYEIPTYEYNTFSKLIGRTDAH